jgi:hypothetical protein
MSDILITKDGDVLDFLETGLDYLANIVVDNILNTIMSDLYSPDFGTDLKHLPRTNIESKEELLMKLTMMKQQIEARILKEQSLTPSTPDEMLSRINITDIVPDADMFGTWRLILQVISQSGESKDISTTINKITKL